MDSEWLRINAIEVSQPIGRFFVGFLPASKLVAVCKTDVRRWQGTEKTGSPDSDIPTYIGIQRHLSDERVKEIRQYVKTADACFPNTIIVSVSSDNVEVESKGEKYLLLRNKPDVASVIDGQHRLAGFSDGVMVEDFDLLVAVFVDLEMEEQANLFSTINTKQTRINPSLAEDLLEFSATETPEKVCHNLVKAMNSDVAGPWHGQIKMLGVKDEISNGIITQHTFVKEVLDLLYPAKELQIEVRDKLKRSNNRRDKLKDFAVDSSRYPLWVFYLNRQDGQIKKILDNYFQAVKEVFPEEWGNRRFILTKSIGYDALMMELRVLLNIGISKDSLSQDFFKEPILNAKRRLNGTQLTGEVFGSSAADAVRLKTAMFG